MQDKKQIDIGEQYIKDDPFRAAARLHQSKYRANVLGVDWHIKGNRLKENDARKLLIYYDGLNVRESLRKRYPNFSLHRDGDLLRSEHIPFNMFAPLLTNRVLAQQIIVSAFAIESHPPYQIRFEYAPERRIHLNDATAFDTYISFRVNNSRNVAIGVEVKYTEGSYAIGRTEKQRVDDRNSSYWRVTWESGAFADPDNKALGSDDLRQIWRNHLLGLSMCLNGELDNFYSITLYPAGNHHFKDSIYKYQTLLKEEMRRKVYGCTYEQFIAAINGGDSILAWKQYLSERYLVNLDQ